MKKQLLTAGMLLAASGAFAFGDPDFERTEPRELPLWSGAQWAKASTVKYTAKIVEAPNEAASGKRFLRVENPHKTSVYVIAYPALKPVPGYGFKVTCKVKGNGLRLVGVTPYGADGKPRKWKNLQQTGFKRLTSETWEPVEFKYVPEEGDVSLMVGLSIRDGRVDYDDFKLETFKIDDAAAGKAPAPAQKN